MFGRLKFLAVIWTDVLAVKISYCHHATTLVASINGRKMLVTENNIRQTNDSFICVKLPSIALKVYRKPCFFMFRLSLLTIKWAVNSISVNEMLRKEYPRAN